MYLLEMILKNKIFCFKLVQKKHTKRTIWWKITFMDLSNAFSTAFFSVSESHKIIDRISACSSLFKGSAVQVILSQKDSFLHQLIQNMTAYCPLSYSLINRRQLHIFFTQAKTWHRIVCWFSWISLNSPVFASCDHKIVLFWSAEQSYDHIMQKLVKTGKNTVNLG